MDCSANFCTIWPSMAEAISFLFGAFVPRCTHRIDKRFDYNVLQFADGGGVELSVDGDVKRLQGRWFWSSYPGPRIRFAPASPHKTWVHRYLAFTGPGVQRWREAGIFPIAPQAVHGGDFAQRFDELLELSRRSDRWGVARASLLLETLLTELGELRGRASTLPGWIEPVLARARQLGEAASQEQLAAEAGMSPRTFRRQFQAVMGVPAIDFVIARRIDHAKEMLGTTALPIKNVAEQLGYRDVFFFTRQFRKVTGVTPAAYRRSREH